MPNYIRKPYNLTCRGVGLRHPPDLMPDGLYPILNNMTVRQLGGLQSRAGTILLTPLNFGGPVHSIKRLNDTAASTFVRVIGAGTSVYLTSSTVPLDVGYSGVPLSMVPYRPAQAARPWMYLSDGTRSRKVRADRLSYPQGTAPPPTAPVVARGVPQFNVIEQFNAVGGWVPSGTAGTIATPNRFATTITQILHDSSTVAQGWASITAPLDMNYQTGALIILNGTETAKIRQVFEPITNTTIASILYDSGTTGPCSIVLTDQTTGLQPDAMVQISSEYVRVLSVSTGVDGTVSFRCNTTIAHANGEPITGLASFRVYTAGTISNGNTLTGQCFESPIGAGIGYLSLNTSAAPLNEALAYPDGLGSGQSRPIHPEDYLHVSLQIDNPIAITNIRFILNIDPVFPSDFTKIANAYYKDIGPSAFQPVVNSTLTVFAAQQNAVQQNIVNNTVADINAPPSERTPQVAAAIPSGSPTGGISTDPNAAPLIDYTVPGDSAWTEFHFKVSELSRIGSDQHRSLATVTGLIILIQCTAPVAFFVSSWWIGGTYGLDSKGSVPYTFYQKYRSSVTGTRSNPSPIVRAPIDLQRERCSLIPVPSPDLQVDKIDIFAVGGTLTQPLRVLTVPNSSTPVNIDVTDAAVLTNEVLSFKDFQPFPVSDLPRLGTCNVSGTSVQWVSGDTFNVNWQTGSEIIINSAVYTLYSTPASTTRLELIENAGALTGASFFIPEATIGGQPLPSMAGPDPLTGSLLAVGDPKNAGKLYWTNPNDPDAASDENEYEVTSPSEPLQSVFIYNGRAYVYSTERLFSCYAGIKTDPVTGVQKTTYTAQEVPSSKGSYGIYSVAVTESFYSAAKNGIWEAGLSGLNNTTDETLYPLFSQKGQDGTFTNGYFPIDFTHPNDIRLYPTKSAVYFTYIDTQGNHQTMLYDKAIPQPGWFPLQYTPQPACFYEEDGPATLLAPTMVLMGGQDGQIYELGHGASDNGVPIAFDFFTQAIDLGDTRQQKLFADYMIDLDPANVTITMTPYANNLLMPLPSATISGKTGRQQIEESVITPTLSLYLNLALHVQGSTTTTIPSFYEIQVNGVTQPYLATQMTSPNYVSHGFANYGHIKDGWFTYISTTPVTFTVTTDAGLTYTVTLPSSNGVIAKKYMLFSAMKGLLFFYSATSTAPFQSFNEDTFVHVKEWGNPSSYVPYMPFAGQGV